MPRKKSGRSSAPAIPSLPYALPDKAEWGGFINVRLTSTQMEQMDEWLDQNTQAMGVLLDDILGSGLKVGLTFDPDHSCYICSFTGALCSEDPETRYVLTSRGSTYWDAVGINIYKHNVVAAGDHSSYRPSTQVYAQRG